jgi:two-component system, chemotaxis family, CheB/CheR fusion protein
LPAGPLHPLLRRQVGGNGEGHDVVELDAVNRRGRPVRLRVTVTVFTQGSDGPAGAVVLMDPTDP